MRPGTDVLMITAMGALGWVAGMLFTPSAAWNVIGLAVGVALGLMMARAGVRPAIGPAIAGGAIIGAWIGREIVRALCLPGSCPTVEVVGSLFTGLGSMVGIGLVVALVVRSFDEYRESGETPRPR